MAFFSNHYFTKNHKIEPDLHLVTHIRKHTKDTSWDFDETFCPMKIRICKFRINEPGTGKEEWEVLLTNLDKVEFSLEKIKYLYHLRWRIGAEK